MESCPNSSQRRSSVRESADSDASCLTLVEKAREVEVAMDALLARIHLGTADFDNTLQDLKLLSRTRAAELLDLSLSQLDRLTVQGSIPTVWLDRRPRYRATELREWITARSERGETREHRSNPQNKKIMITHEFSNGGRPK